MKKLSLALALLFAAGLSRPAAAQDYPQQTIKFVVAFGPGGGTDIIARILAEAMQRKMGKPVIVENKPGAGGILGNDVVAKATPDGYTLGVMTAGQIIAAVTKKNMPYNTNTAFAPVSQIATASLMIVTRPDFPANNAKELVAYAKANPGKVVFASPGFAATQHFAGEMFKQTAGVELLHVPFKTTPEAINAVLGKHADVLFDTVSAVIGQVKAGQLKALAVTGKDRFPAVPDVPPAADSGVLPGYDVTTWYGVFAPAGTPPAVIAKLNKVLNEALQEDDVKTRMAAVGVLVEGSTPDEFGKFLASEYKAGTECARSPASCRSN
jgi:tripartite-type tricarboxylate transporter receptor subunit TctC